MVSPFRSDDCSDTASSPALGNLSCDDLQAATATDLARLGFRLVELADGTFLATHPDCCTPLADLAHARRFAMRLQAGGQS